MNHQPIDRDDLAGGIRLSNLDYFTGVTST